MRTYFVKVGFYVFTQPYAYQTIIKCLPEDVIDVAKAAVIKKYSNCNSLVTESIIIQKIVLLD